MYLPGLTELATLLVGSTVLPHSAPAPQPAPGTISPFADRLSPASQGGINPTQNWVDHWSEPTTSTGPWLQTYYEQAFPNASVLTTQSAFNFLAYAVAADDQVLVRPLDDVHALKSLVFQQSRRTGTGGEVLEEVTFGGWTVAWEDWEAKVFFAQWMEGFLRLGQTTIVSDNKEKAEQFFAKVKRWQTTSSDSVWVYDQGYWSQDTKLYEAIQKASWDNVILSDEQKKAIQNDYRSFFKNEKQYKDLNVPWKRGLIFLGPPGNGKTVSIKAIMKEMQIPLLYVKSFRQYSGPQGGIRDVFNMARLQAPCLLVLEDLDSLINDENRSFFLNEVDGLEDNDGLLLIGSTNHFDRLDPALSNRPSRFDRKYLFDNPNKAERRQYAVYWQTKLASNNAVKFPDSLVDHVADKTEGFSFAYLQEAFVSALLSIATIDNPEDRPEFEPELKKEIKKLADDLKRGKGDSYNPPHKVFRSTLMGPMANGATGRCPIPRELMTKCANPSKMPFTFGEDQDSDSGPITWSRNEARQNEQPLGMNSGDA